MRLDVALTPERVDHAALPASTAMVIDVLRASTTMITALANGCRGVVPVADPAEALARARAIGLSALAGGERKGRPLPGFDFGNSPFEVTRDRVADRTLVFTTSNGTAALLAARPAAALGVAAFVNVTAAAAWALAERRDVSVVCAGERGGASLEDEVCAGLLLDRVLQHEPGAELTETARDALRTARGYGKAVTRLAEDSAWARHLAHIGRGADVAACLAVDTTTLVPIWSVDKVVGGSR